uniref:Uncharacterized protein n=1 Tax=Aquila chrysaetos chrysaetos TaxID=223781 RepID=A0A663ECE8_AQUCH
MRPDCLRGRVRMVSPNSGFPRLQLSEPQGSPGFLLFLCRLLSPVLRTYAGAVMLWGKLGTRRLLAGPRGQKVSKVFPSSHCLPFLICQSRALTSLATVKPTTWSRADDSWGGVWWADNWGGGTRTDPTEPRRGTGRGLPRCAAPSSR